MANANLPASLALLDDVLRFEEEALPEAGETVKKLYTGANAGKLMLRVKDV